MKMKKLYDQTKIVRNLSVFDEALPDPTKPEGVVLEVLPGAVTAVRIIHAGAVQKFTPKLIAQATREGWMTMGQGTIELQGEAGVVVYTVERTPGYYCCFCDAACGDGQEAAAHVETLHTLPSPDATNPRGYRRDNFYYCNKQE